MATLDNLRDLGYEVGIAFEGDDFKVFRVTGFGLDTQVQETDFDGIDRIRDSHEERVKQQDETIEETQIRWHEDESKDFSLPEEQVEKLREASA